MSDDPTRRLAATRPVVGDRSVAYVHSDEEFWRQYLYERLRSLTTAVTLVGIVAVAALGVGLWSLLGDPGDGASTERVSRLEAARRRARRATPAASGGQTISPRFASARRRWSRTFVRSRGRRRQPDEDTAAVIEAVDATQQSVAQLEQRIAALEQAAP